MEGDDVKATVHTRSNKNVVRANVLGRFVGATLSDNIKVLSKQGLLNENLSTADLGEASELSTNSLILNALDNTQSTSISGNASRGNLSPFASTISASPSALAFATEVETSTAQLKKRRLVALYLLKHARAVELRKRLLDTINYFHSFQRKFVLDSLCFPWESDAPPHPTIASDTLDLDVIVDISDEKEEEESLENDQDGAESDVMKLFKSPYRTSGHLDKKDRKQLPSSSVFSHFIRPLNASNDYDSLSYLNRASSFRFEGCPDLTATQMKALQELRPRDDEFIVDENEGIVVKDNFGVKV
jgi:hypothetical protein